MIDSEKVDPRHLDLHLAKWLPMSWVWSMIERSLIFRVFTERGGTVPSAVIRVSRSQSEWLSVSVLLPLTGNTFLYTVVPDASDHELIHSSLF